MMGSVLEVEVVGHCEQVGSTRCSAHGVPHLVPRVPWGTMGGCKAQSWFPNSLIILDVSQYPFNKVLFCFKLARVGF